MGSDSPASSPSSSASSTSSPQPCLLLALPLEVLSGIVKLCAEQDKAFKHRVACIRQTSDVMVPFDVSIQKVLEQHEQEGFGRSINQVFRTCRMLSSLAAPLIFDTLKASRAVQNKIYRYHIGPRYVQHFKHIIFDESSDLIGLDYLAASLASFTSLKELTLNASSAKATFGSDRRFLSSSFHATKMVKRINTKIRTLHLNDFPVVDALGYLDLFKSLNEVTIRGPPPTPTEEVAKFATVLRNVEELTLIIHRVPYHLPPSFSETSHEWPKLRSLALNIDLIDQTTISFIQHFRSSLEELTVTTLNDPEDARDSLTIPDEATFPHLRRISLIGTNLAARTVFRDTTSRTFPALDYVRLSYVNYNASGFGHDDENLDSLFERHRFRFLQYDPPDQVFRLEDAEHVQELADDHNVQLYLRDYPSKTSSAFLSEEETPDQIRFQESIGKDLTFTQSRIEEDLERIKDYLETTMAKASESEDVSALYRLLEFLRPLELERFAMLD